MQSYKLDTIDRQIIMLLQGDARLKTKEVAHQVGLTVTPTYDRIKRLEKDGYIAKYVALVDKQKVGKTLVAFCNVSLERHSKPLLINFEAEIKKVPEVIECYHIAGGFDYLLKMVVEDMNSYQLFLTNKLAAIENVATVQSSFVMTEVKHETAIPI